MAEIDHLGPRAETAIKIAGITGMVGGLVAGCEQKPQVDPTGNATEPVPGETMAPPVTEAPVSTTGTPIVEATPTQQEISVDELVNGFGLKETPGYESRTFVIQGDYLVDQYNNAPKAVRAEDGSWRELDLNNASDAEVMYADKVPTGVEYINPEMIYDSDGPVGREVHMRYTGEWKVEEVTLASGEKIHLYSVLGGLRGKDGNLGLGWLAIDAPDFMTEHVSSIQCVTNGSDSVFYGNGIDGQTWTDDMLSQLRVGEKLGMVVEEQTWFQPWRYEAGNVVYGGKSYPEFNGAQRALTSLLYADFPDKFQLTTTEKVAIGEEKWPSRVVSLVFRNGLSIYRSSDTDCPQYHPK